MSKPTVHIYLCSHLNLHHVSMKCSVRACTALMERCYDDCKSKELMLYTALRRVLCSLHAYRGTRGCYLGGRILVEDPEHGHLCCDGFSRARRRSQQHVGVGVVQCVEDLGLDGVEVSELVKALVLSVTQSSHWQRLEV